MSLFSINSIVKHFKIINENKIFYIMKIQYGVIQVCSSIIQASKYSIVEYTIANVLM